MKTTGADSFRVLPGRHCSDHPVHRAVVLGLRAGDRWLVERAGLLYCLLVALLGVSLVLGPASRAGWRRIAIALVVAGGILVLEGILLRSYVGRSGTLQHFFDESLARMMETRRAWFQVAFYAIENVVSEAGRRVLWVGAVLAGTGVALTLATRMRPRSRQLSPLPAPDCEPLVNAAQ